MIKILIILFCLLTLYHNYKHRMIVSSTSVWIACYILIFIVYPLYDSENIYINAELIDIYALIGIMFFYVGVKIGNCKCIKLAKNITTKIRIPRFQLSSRLYALLALLALYFLSTSVGVNTLKMVLLGEMTAKQMSLGDGDGSMDGYGFCVHLMTPCLLSVWMTAVTKRQRFLRYVYLAIYVIFTLLFGFTRIFFISILVIILFYEIRKMGRKVQILYLSLGVGAFIVLMAFMNFIRCLGLGSDVKFKEIIDIDYVFESTDFGASYYWFDRMLSYNSVFINPVVYLKPIFAFIPRSIWPTKPEPLSLQILKRIDPGKASTGYSTAGNSVLGEGFAIMGFLGIIVFPFLWGYICSYLDKNYYARLRLGIDKGTQNIMYYIFAVFIVISGQRGDWCQYMTIVIWFYFMPMLLMSKKVRIE